MLESDLFSNFHLDTNKQNVHSDFFMVQFYSWFKFYFLHFKLIIIIYQT